MVFYESVHCGIIRIKFNEQYLWQYFRERNIRPQQKIRDIAFVVEGALNDFQWKRPLDLDEFIAQVYYKLCKKNDIKV